MPRSELDWGNPTVRDRRRACGNVDHGGIRHPPRLSKERVLETLCLKLCAPQFYPDLPLSQPCVEGGLSRADSLSYDGPGTDMGLGFTNGYGIRSHERIWD